MAAIRVLVVDDHELIRRYIATVLATDGDMEIVSQAVDGYEAIRQAEELQPDVVLLDISLPNLNGLQAAPIIRKAAPKTEILVITTHDTSFFVQEAFAAGARGFISKADLSAELITAVKDVYAKKRFVTEKLRNLVTDEEPPTAKLKSG